jgi:hypothetical protein
LLPVKAPNPGTQTILRHHAWDGISAYLHLFPEKQADKRSKAKISCTFAIIVPDLLG